jgi:hypothetical protein
MISIALLALFAATWRFWRMTLFVAMMAVIVIGLSIAAIFMHRHFVATSPPDALVQSMPAAAKDGKQRFAAPSEASMPGGDYGKVIQLGENVFIDTKKYAGKYVGNDLSCANCHLDAGRKPDSAPMWAAFIHYPAFRSKTGKVDTLASRIQGCFLLERPGGMGRRGVYEQPRTAARPTVYQVRGGDAHKISRH